MHDALDHLPRIEQPAFVPQPDQFVMDTLTGGQCGEVVVVDVVFIEDAAAVQGTMAANVRLAVGDAYGTEPLPPHRAVLDRSQPFQNPWPQVELVCADRSESFVCQHWLKVILQPVLSDRDRVGVNRQ